ncbi:MAG TPA: hypothetical protein VFB67_11105 [Candidatus Polarisedimenticolaceae bacterium]|nr:hypothetical protein [Candidatus Polarisedimenticolaceae bacterium]
MRRTLALNLALAASAALAMLPQAPGPLRMAGAAAVVLALPGVAWLGLFRRATLTPARLALAVVGVSCILATAALAIGSLAAPPPRPWLLLGWTFLAVNAGLAVAGPWPRLAPGTPWRLLAGTGAAGFALTSCAALYLVPPLEDHDMEVRGTAYGLVSELKPYFTSNRELYLPMSHPVLFNALVAQSLVVTGEIDAARPSYDSAKRAEAAARSGVPFDWTSAWRSDYEAFLARPALVGTRAPSAFFAALILALLADLVIRMTGRVEAALAACALYAFVPETIVRSAYAGYFGETVFAMLVAAALLAEPAGTGWIVAAGGMMAVMDHKTVIFAAAVATWLLGRSIVLHRRLDPRGVALAAGFAAGTAAWWAYGFWVDAHVFVEDHLRRHIAHRLLLNDVRLLSDPAHHYAPSIPELWIEFARHTGWVLVPLAAAAAVLALLRPADDARAILAVWFLSGAVAYSLTDWRQTKHLMNGLAPMVVLVAAWLVSRERLRAAGIALAGAALVLCLRTDVHLVRDFSSLRVSGASDVDGW